MLSPDFIGGSHHKEFRIPYRDPLVKPEDDIVGNSKIPKNKSRIPRAKNTHAPPKKQKILRNFISVFLCIFKHYRFSSFVVWSIASLVVIAFEFAS